MKMNITRQNLSVYIEQRVSHNISRRKEYYIYGDILVLVKDPLPHDVDLYGCLKQIEELIPKDLVYGLDSGEQTKLKIILKKFREKERINKEKTVVCLSNA